MRELNKTEMERVTGGVTDGVTGGVTDGLAESEVQNLREKKQTKTQPKCGYCSVIITMVIGGKYYCENPHCPRCMQPKTADEVNW